MSDGYEGQKVPGDLNSPAAWSVWIRTETEKWVTKNIALYIASWILIGHITVGSPECSTAMVSNWSLWTCAQELAPTRALEALLTPFCAAMPKTLVPRLDQNRDQKEQAVP